MSGFEYNIIEKIGVLSSSPTGWTKELNLISWNDRAPKFDIRSWSPDHQKMGKGLTFSNDELKKIHELLETMKL